MLQNDYFNLTLKGHSDTSLIDVILEREIEREKKSQSMMRQGRQKKSIKFFKSKTQHRFLCARERVRSFAQRRRRNITISQPCGLNAKQQKKNRNNFAHHLQNIVYRILAVLPINFCTNCTQYAFAIQRPIRLFCCISYVFLFVVTHIQLYVYSMQNKKTWPITDQKLTQRYLYFAFFFCMHVCAILNR